MIIGRLHLFAEYYRWCIIWTGGIDNWRGFNFTFSLFPMGEKADWSGMGWIPCPRCSSWEWNCDICHNMGRIKESDLDKDNG